MRKWGLLFFFFLAFGFYLRNVSPSVTAGDSGEFITAAATLSLPHAPSFPLYTLTARCFIRAVPWASVGTRCNMFSAFSSACTLLVICWLVHLLSGDLLIAVLLAAVTGVTASFWENSLVTEVFALNALLCVVLFWCLTRAREGGIRFYGLFAFLLGVGLGNHQIIILTVPAFIICVFSDANRMQVVRQLRYFVLLGFIGFSINIFLPVRSMKEPPLNWGQPTTVSKFVRTITRKDYGALTLALGETPARNLSNTKLHLMGFLRHMKDEVPWPALILGLFGFIWGLRKKDSFTLMMLGVFLLSGPFFLLLGNLPFNAQSDGIIGRFYILPVLAFILGGISSFPNVPIGNPVCFKERFTDWIPAFAGMTTMRCLVILVLFVSFLFGLQKGWAEACAHRQGMLVLDYGRAMLRTLPPQAVLFMDGGDDAFYSLAMLRYAMGKRPDVSLHDRGGLVFKNPYGSDFRSIPKDQKNERRWKVEREHLLQRDLFYSTMDSAVLPGARMKPVGFLMEAEKNAGLRISWPIILLRSWVPLQPNDYRTRALAAFFPFMQGKYFLREQKIAPALVFLKKAGSIGYDIDWLKNNLGFEYAQLAYAQLMANNFPLAESVYRQWIQFEPSSEQAQGNLGVVLEKQGRITEAKEQYQKSAELFSGAADPVFNLAVLAWKESDWSQVVVLLEEVIRRRPDHRQAQGYLRVAREKMSSRGRP